MKSPAEREAALAERRERLSESARRDLEVRLREGSGGGTGASDLVPLSPGTGTPFFCAHPAWGDVLAYRGLAGHLGRPFYGLESPGLHGGTPPRTLAALAERYVDGIYSAVPDGPRLLGGWSLGGLVAFEMARVLERRGEPAAVVVLLDTEAPCGPEEAPDRDAELARAAAWLGPAATPERIERMFSAFDSNLSIVSDWTPDPGTTPLALFRRAGAAPSLYTGWRALCPFFLADEEVDADHFTLLSEPAVSRLAVRLGEVLSAAEREAR